MSFDYRASVRLGKLFPRIASILSLATKGWRRTASPSAVLTTNDPAHEVNVGWLQAHRADVVVSTGNTCKGG